jgi:hypothetical protein
MNSDSGGADFFKIARLKSEVCLRKAKDFRFEYKLDIASRVVGETG